MRARVSFAVHREIHAFVPLSAATSAHHETRTPPSGGRGRGHRPVEPSVRDGRSSGRPPLLLLVQRIVPRTFPETSEETAFLLSGRFAKVACNKTLALGYWGCNWHFEIIQFIFM